MTGEEFAAHTGATLDEIERYRSLGLLDLDEDGVFDAVDALRLQFLLTHVAAGRSVDSFGDEVLSSGNNVLITAFAKPSEPVPPDEAAKMLGFSLEQLRALGSAMGYRVDGSLGEFEMAMVRHSRTMMDAGLAFEGLLEGARVYADTLRRLSEASLEITHRYLCEPLIRAGVDEREIATQVGTAIDVIGPTAESLLKGMHAEYMRRAALAHAISHLEPRDPDAPPGSSRSTIVFVDLALFSSLAEIEGDEAAVRVVDRFDQSVRELSNEHDGRVVKQIGDEFMLIFREPVAAVRFAVQLRERMAQTERFLALRTGIHYGAVLYRLGDYWGRTVNVAARIVSMAMPGSILVTEPVAKAAVDQGIDVVELGVRELRGMEEPIGIYRVVVDGGG